MAAASWDPWHLLCLLSKLDEDYEDTNWPTESDWLVTIVTFFVQALKEDAKARKRRESRKHRLFHGLKLGFNAKDVIRYPLVTQCMSVIHNSSMLGFKKYAWLHVPLLLPFFDPFCTTRGKHKNHSKKLRHIMPTLDHRPKAIVFFGA